MAKIVKYKAMMAASTTSQTESDASTPFQSILIKKKKKKRDPPPTCRLPFLPDPELYGHSEKREREVELRRQLMLEQAQLRRLEIRSEDLATWLPFNTEFRADVEREMEDVRLKVRQLQRELDEVVPKCKRRLFFKDKSEKRSSSLRWDPLVSE